MLTKQLVLKNCKNIYTMEGSGSEDLGLIHDQSILVEDEKIKSIGDFEDFDLVDDVEIIDCSGKSILPGFVDAHTHLVFGGDRRDEYFARLKTDDEDEIRDMVPIVGMDSSMHQTKEATFDELYDQSIFKLSHLVRNGITTIEIKSGYGIDKDVEIKQLEVIKKLKEDLRLTIISTYLGGHDWPKDMSRDEYVDFMIDEVLPIIVERDLADMVDIWTESDFFSKEQGRKMLQAGIDAGLQATIHTDEFSSIGASGMAAEVGAYNAAHLNYVTDEEIELMKENGTVGIILPTTDYQIQHKDPANGRHLIDQGLTVALATNNNPGNYTLSPSIVIDMACRNHGLTVEEAFRGFTINGAKALRLEEDYGTLEEGKYGDIQIWDIDDILKVAYYHGGDFVQTVIKHGEVIAEKSVDFDWRKK